MYYQLEEHLKNAPNTVLTTNAPTHKIEGGYIYTSMKEGTALISYQAVAIQDGAPAIPDDPHFTRAFKNYVEVEFLKMLYRNKKVERAVLEHAEQEYAWAVGAYETDSKSLNLSKAESFFNTHSRLLVSRSEFITRFKNLGK